MKYLLIWLCLTTTTAQGEILETHSMATYYLDALQLSEQYGKQNTLIVFDIDNTLLTFKDHFGSVQWMKWQKGLFNTRSPHKLANNFQELLYLQMIIYEIRPLVPVDGSAAGYFNTLVHRGHQVLIHTSRGPLKRNTTEKELLRNSILPQTGPYLEVQGPSSMATIQNSLFMTEGQDKGVMLKKLLQHTQVKPKVILFLDDDMKNIHNLETAFRGTQIKTRFYHYTKMQPQVEKFNNSTKSTSIKKGQALMHSLNTILR